MTKPNILSICLLAALMATQVGCGILPHQREDQARDREVQVRDREVQVRDREAQVRDREAQVRDREAQVRDREAQMSDRETKTRKAQTGDRQAKGRVAFSDRDIAAIRNYYSQGNQPGITAGRIMKVRLGEPYPFGYTWRSLPKELDARLSPLPDGHIRVIIGTEIAILNVRTRVVVDRLEIMAGLNS